MSDDDFTAVEHFKKTKFNILAEIMSRLNLLNPQGQVDTLLSLLPYVLPKIKPIEASELIKHRVRDSSEISGDKIREEYRKAHKAVMDKTKVIV